MCGFVGILHRGAQPDAPRMVARMAQSIAHRGPDDDGFWSDDAVALGFRRLAIVDIDGGHQPMTNEDGSIRLVFNGEIYNHVALRRELEAAGHVFATDHSDTEVLVHGYEEWGEDLLPRLNGMFAFAVWDRPRKRLLMARDRLGIKPLYLAERPDGTLAFASEVRALHASGLVAAAPDATAVLEYFLQQNVWGSRSMFAGVRQLEPGHLLVADERGMRDVAFWGIAFNRRRFARGEAAEAVRETVEASIRRQLAADVPVMAYLSGGIDSSAIVAGAHRLDPGVRAYSCLFDLADVGDDRIVDEREFSRAVAGSLGIAHVELELPALALAGALSATVLALEEPRMGMAYVNYLIAGRVAKDSKVVLSGCGGDEILAGYVGRYAHIASPYVTAQPAGRSLGARLRRRLFPPPPPRFDPRARMLELLSFPVRPHERAAAFTPEFLAAAGDYDVGQALDGLIAQCPSDDPRDRLMYVDLSTYLAGLLMVEDKLSMVHSLETRVPLLDNELIDLAFSLDWEHLTDGGTGKIAFRDAIRDWVPPVVADKPKMGFGPPDASWYRGVLQPYIREMLAPRRIAARGILRPDFVATAVEEHMSGKANRLPLIWSLLSFEAWCESFGLYGGRLAQAA